jgi:hypothetical protein
MNRIARITLWLLASTALPATAQSVRGTDVESVLVPGDTVWITDATGREEKTSVVGVSAGIVTTSDNGATRRLRVTEIARIRARRSDSLVNGAIIGAGAAVATGLFLCQLTEPWANCRDDVGPMLRIGALGAGIGIGIDALIRGRRTLYESEDGLTLYAAPIAARRTGGVQVALRF